MYSAYTWNISKTLGYSTHCQGISQFYLYTLRFIHKRNEPYMPLHSLPQLVLIYWPRRDGRLSKPWCEVAPAEIRTCNRRHSTTQPLAQLCTRLETDRSCGFNLRPWTLLLCNNLDIFHTTLPRAAERWQKVLLLGNIGRISNGSPWFSLHNQLFVTESQRVPVCFYQECKPIIGPSKSGHPSVLTCLFPYDAQSVI